MSKIKILFTITLFVLFLFAIPIFQSLLFSSSALKNSKIVVNKEIDADFLKNIDKENIVLFFGYVGCTDVCTPILEQLNNIFLSNEAKNLKDKASIVFVNLIPQIDSEQPQLFASFFNKDFIGLHLSKKDLYAVDRKFGLFYSAGVSNEDGLSHSDFIYLLKKQNDTKTVLKNIYMTHPINSKELIKDIKELL
ncbi:MAG: hypothetical protein A2513_01845 [Sulfurimonas sp. RIFOXYD12_FULL_33_39]|uniref:SCO family protein n=1 Tax=unclassified Sulfurimonas TaxID=2623549 RepID=UPI0008C9CE5C|nr:MULTISPECIES: SCO family protein [unclassified Sulfurimonas]OHE07561.1 MAG: hypothetical protein A3G74_07320 [Sulfurimonas sp. RIFCSPLOWO2_12_FULL_34_6]OHE08737.1 MAG: hypothetical protein A2513_01845 [Sulfurimonas sp. RIFOXYD12_FULL_33_39]OHE14022.1 MAG: hypothetical protein A2530_03170 [Sulfurimonas sp. RIFOXYD2_FULL_34_21]